tara:strand:+ start:489 stop:1520 length:1032 start_codon:yes stop_codon:yes gene_type:complete
MNDSKKKFKIHIKNNRWKKGSFPNTPEGEKVFTITNEHFQNSLIDFPHLEQNIDTFIDWDEDNFTESIKTSDILITWNLPTNDLKNIAPNLKWIHCIGAGVEHLSPFDWLPSEVILTNNKGVHRKKAGEFGLMSILMLHNHFPKVINNQFKKNYNSLYSTPISGKTAVIVGTGSLGGSVGELLEPLGVNVIGVNRQGKNLKGFSKIVQSKDIDTVLPQADFLYVALPETPDTIEIINEKRLKLLKKSCGIVNVGRSSAINYSFLFEMLKSEKIAGAILDVFTPEPIPSNAETWDIPNLIVSPHISADDGNSYIKNTLLLFLKNLDCFVSNKTLVNQVDRSLGY